MRWSYTSSGRRAKVSMMIDSKLGLSSRWMLSPRSSRSSWISSSRSADTFVFVPIESPPFACGALASSALIGWRSFNISSDCEVSAFEAQRAIPQKIHMPRSSYIEHATVLKNRSAPTFQHGTQAFHILGSLPQDTVLNGFLIRKLDALERRHARLVVRSA